MEPVPFGTAAPRSPEMPPRKRAKGSVGFEVAHQPGTVMALVTSSILQRLTQMEETAKVHAEAIIALRAEVSIHQSRIRGLETRTTLVEVRLPEAQAPLAGHGPPAMTDEEDAAALRPPLTRQEIDDLLDDTASEPDGGPVEDHWAHRAAEL